MNDSKDTFEVSRDSVERIRERRMAALPPASNTGGKPSAGRPADLAMVDTLTWTLPIVALDPRSEDPALSVMHDPEAIAGAVERAFLAPLRMAVGEPTGRRVNGYHDSAPLLCPDLDPATNGAQNLGYVAWGGNRNKNGQDTLCVYLTGQACEHINLLDGRPDLQTGWGPWSALVLSLREHAAKVTRLDVAYDDLDGSLGGVTAAVGWYRQGLYSAGGRPPSVAQAGDWINGRSRTLYVGRRENGKLQRVYEKGHQLGDMASRWVRYEVELRSVDRVLDPGLLLTPTAVLVGSAPAYERISTMVPRTIRTIVKERLQVTLQTLQGHASVAYGRLLNAMLATGMTAAEVVDALRIDGLPRRLYVPAALVAPPGGV